MSAWVTVDACCGLPDIEATHPGAVAKKLKRLGVPTRQQPGRGGRLEYAIDGLPPRARDVLRTRLAAGAASGVATPANARPDRLATAGRDARARADAIAAQIRDVRYAVDAGARVDAAVRAAVARGPLGRSQLYAHYSRTLGMAAGPSLLAALLHGNVARRGRTFTLSHPFVTLFLKHKYKLHDGLKGRMTVGSAAAYRRAVDEATAQGIPEVADYTTVTRVVRREMKPATLRFLEEGPDGLRRTIPRLARDRTGLVPLKRIEADQHVLNWLVAFDDGSTGRATGIFAVDAATGLLFGVHLDRTERAFGYRRLFAQIARQFGIRRDGTTVAIDNGAGAAYANTSRSRRRYVGSRAEAERRPVGALERLGYDVDPQPPAHPWLKGTIESMNRLLDEELRAHPDLPGTAYLGNAPDDRPEHGGTAGVPEALFRLAVDNVVARINSFPSPAPEAQGASREAFFRATLAADEVVKVDELYAATLCYPSEYRTVDAHIGSIKLHENRYYAPEAADTLLQATTPRNRTVEVFYDDGPGGLQKGVWVHSAEDQRFLCHVPLFDERVADVERLRAHKQARRAHTRSAIEGAKQAAAAVQTAPKLAAAAGIAAPTNAPAPRPTRECFDDMIRVWDAAAASNGPEVTPPVRARGKKDRGAAPPAPLRLVPAQPSRASA